MKHMKLFESFENSSLVSKGQKINVKLTYLQGEPDSMVEAYNDSWETDGNHTFSFLFGGDMMMLAHYDQDKNQWYSK